MQRTTIKAVLLAFVLASAIPLAACDDDPETPTTPTQPGPPVGENPTPTPPPDEPTPPTPPPDDGDDDDDVPPTVSVTGTVVNLNRSGTDGLDISFRIDDFTIVRASGSTPVIIGSNTDSTRAILSGMNVTAEGRRTNGFLDATRLVVNTQ